MIPKMIHYCWFGGNTLSPLSKKCISSWKKYCPDFEYREWNESNFDINCNEYVKQAYKAKKYAFVSDYVRLYALYNYGGIYLDTDIEVLKPIDHLLENEAFSGFESAEGVTAWLMACTQYHPFFRQLLECYNDRSFIKSDGSYDLTTNVKVITEYCVQNGLELNNILQTISGVTYYPQNYFSPKDYFSGKVILTDQTYTIHHFAGSWLPVSEKWRNGMYRFLGPQLSSYYKSIKKYIKSRMNICENQKNNL